MATETKQIHRPFQENSGKRLGIDLGGTKIEGIVLSATGEILERTRLPTPVGNYPATLEAIEALVNGLVTRQGLKADTPLGIGTPGAISLKTGLMMNCNSTVLNGKPLHEHLRTRLRREVRIGNDADCFALSEASDGAAKDANCVFGVILGTGTGGGIVVNRQLLQGANAIAGEWGHNTLAISAYQQTDTEPAGPSGDRICFCGRRNCVETWLAGPSFERSFIENSPKMKPGENLKVNLKENLKENFEEHQAPHSSSNPGSSVPDNPLAAPAIVQLAMAGNRQAETLLAQYTNLLALALSNVINIIDPGVIVLGGGMSNIQYLYEHLPHYLPRYVFSDTLNTRIVPAKHGDSSGVRGAAWLWPNE